MQEEHAEAPRVRITTFGSLQVAYRKSEGTWQEVAAEDWGETSYPRRLLCFLLFHRRQASRSKLLDVLWADNESVHLDATLNRTVSSLRRVLHGQELLTLHARTVYRLAEQERVWWDYQAFEALWQEAERVGPTSEQGCLLLEQANSYVQHRQVLEDIEDRWCGAVRDKVEVAIYRMHLWLAEAYEAQERLREAEEQLEEVLSWEPLDGNALLRLMHVQAAQGYTSQALSRYQRALVQAAKQGRALPAEVETLARRLCGSPVVLPATQELILPDAQLRDGGGLSLLVLPGGWRRIDTRLFELRQALLASWVQQWMGRAAECQALQAILAQEISMLDHHSSSTDTSETVKFSRRKVIESLVAIPATLIVLQYGSLNVALLEEFLPQCAAAVTACWYLINDGDFDTVQRALAAYLPSLETIVRQSDLYRTVAAHLAAQAYLLAGLFALHRGSLIEREAFCRKAVVYAQESGDRLLLVKSEGSLAYTLYMLQQDTNALHLWQKAEIESVDLLPFSRSEVFIKLATTYGRTNHQQEALRYMGEARALFPETTSGETPVYLSSNFGSFSLLLYEGKTMLELGQYDPHGGHFQQAENVFSEVENIVDVPERFRVEVLIYRAEAALHRDDMDAFCAYLEQGIQGAQALGSRKRRQEAMVLYKAVRQSTHKWRDEGRVKDLGDLLLH